uniref:Uncharacterized protein n=1 Tax=Spongospora subterranea TaxID=70186 RepID=A0A0H5QEM0_9EUKA|eukprot:CRZ00488.1 hypothetical protein [Spongospora subterranea]
MVSLALPSQGLKDSFVTLRCPATGTLNWGAFFQAIVSFLIISVCVFVMVKMYTKASLQARRKQTLAKLPRFCTECDMEVSKRARRCPHCTSNISDGQTDAKKIK